MKTEHPAVLVIGLGAMGSAVVYQLAKRGVKVIGIDQFTPPHAYGSTHGETRITRQAIGEGSRFVPLAMRSHQLWREIEAESGQTLLTTCGGLIMARSGSASRMHEQMDFLGNTIRAAKEFGVPHEQLDASAIASRFPQFILQGDEIGYFEPGAGYLAPEACVAAQLTLAAHLGADIRFGETVHRVTQVGGKTNVETDRGCFTAGATVIATGPWLSKLMPAFAELLTVRRQVLYWFETETQPTATLAPKGHDSPVFIWHWGDGADDFFYGFPEVGCSGAIKVATEQHVVSTTPDAVRRDVGEDEIAAMYSQHVAGRLRGVGPHCVKAATCLYTNVAGANFIIDRLLDAPDTIVVSACSGHGFKHSAAIGEALASMVISNLTPDVLRPFVLTVE